jgi:protocatechuate 4,5-dioxygenase alpha subunit
MKDIPGTHVFTGERSQQGYRLNRLSMTLTRKENREAFLADEDGYMESLGLTPGERELVRRRDWAAIIETGGNIYLTLKIAATVGQNLLQMGAQMRGEDLASFMATRPGAKSQVRKQ